MILLNGFELGGGGDNCDPNTTYYLGNPALAYYGSCIGFDVPTNPDPTQTPWWQSLVSGIAQGATHEIFGGDKPATQPTLPLPIRPAAPWYTTPIGIGGLAVGGLVLILLLRK
jgi:hypothetical protein